MNSEVKFPWEGRIVMAQNLPYDISPTELRDFLISKGKILRVDIERDKAGQANGIGYIEFNSKADAESSLSLNGQQLGGRKFKCYISNNPPPELIRFYIRNPMERPVGERIKQRILEQAKRIEHPEDFNENDSKETKDFSDYSDENIKSD